MTAIEVALALIWRSGQLVITRRPLDKHLGGLWEFPGGKLECGESPADAARREALEEVGIVCNVTAARDPIDHVYSSRRVRLYPIDCIWVRGEAINREVLEHRWVHPLELSAIAFPEANRELIQKLSQ